LGIFNKLKNFIKSKFFILKNKNLKKQTKIYNKKYSSYSENLVYVSEIENFLEKPKMFYNFKRNSFYRDVVETVKQKEGYEYLKILESRNDGFLKEGLETVLISDIIGNPLKYFYKGYANPLSPTTLRYLKVASDLNILFGNKFHNVAEIGAGYGGQTLINDQILEIYCSKLFDLPNVNQLIEKYLNYFLLKGSYKTTTLNNEPPSNYDLVISNYAFSELPKDLQIVYVDKVLKKSKRGYLTMNSGMGGLFSDGKLSAIELKSQIPKIKFLEEYPLTYKYNYVAVWGFEDNNIIEKNFKEKIL
tara:strand:- start:21714 stop:22622 length:909 start_codon:yes stop_codon:yes gene_type:complete